MGNENNKSFGDLFSSAIDNNSSKDDVTFDNLFSKSESDTGNDVSELVKSDDEEDINVNVKDNENSSFGSIFESALKNTDKEEDVLVSDVTDNEKEVISDSKVEDVDNASNIFFNNVISEEVKEDKSDIVENIFFGSNDSSLEESTSKYSNLENEELDVKDNFLDNVGDKKDDVEEEPKSVSPFFVEDVEGDNSFSELSKINLIENNLDSKVVQKLDLDSSKHYDVKIVKKKESLFKFVLGVISYAIFIWLLLVGVTLLVYVLDIKIRAAKGDYSSPTFNAYVVLTGSMLPDIQVYDVVVTKKVEASSLEVGDVITFASADSRFLNTIITHRIIKKTYDKKTKTYSFQTQGDNNNVADNALVPEANIYGKVILKIPKLGYLQEFLASDGGWIIVILIPCVAVISYDVVKLAKGLKKKKYKNITVQK